MSVDIGELPEGWAGVKLGDVSDLESGAGFPLEHQGKPGLKYPFFKVGSLAEVGSGEILTTSRDTVDDELARRLKAKIIPAESVIFAKIGMAIRLNRRRLVGSPCCIDNNLMAAIPSRAVLPRFLLRYLETQDFMPLASATTVPSIRKSALEEVACPLPPMAEQRRIVAALERVLGRVTAARDRLNRVPATLKRFRQAVLAAACSGRLTTGGRIDFASLEPHDEGGTAVPDPELLTASGLEDLPRIWTIVPVEMLRDSQRGISYGVLKPGPYVENGIPLLRIVDIETGIAETKNAHRIGAELSQQYSRTVLQGGEVLVSVVGTIGKVAVVPPDLCGANIHRNLALVAPSARVDARYLALALSSPWMQRQINHVTVGASQPLFNLGDLKRVLVPLPPLSEQRDIVCRVSELVARADTAEEKLTAARRKVDSLTQAILAKAFRGELVPTEAELARRENRNYETAFDMLARLLAEKERTSGPLKPGRKRPS